MGNKIDKRSVGTNLGPVNTVRCIISFQNRNGLFLHLEICSCAKFVTKEGSLSQVRVLSWCIC